MNGEMVAALKKLQSDIEALRSENETLRRELTTLKSNNTTLSRRTVPSVIRHLNMMLKMKNNEK